MPKPSKKVGGYVERIADLEDLDLRLKIAEAAFNGVAIDEHEPPFFYEVKVPFIGHSSSLSDMCGRVNDAISQEFNRYDVRMPAALRQCITASAMLAGNADQALAYLLRWVDVACEDDQF